MITQHKVPSGQLLHIAQGDLTLEAVDAIVNAANRELQHGQAAWLRRSSGAAVRRSRRRAMPEVREHGTVAHGEPATRSGENLPPVALEAFISQLQGEIAGRR